MFTHIISFDLNNTYVRFADTCRTKENFSSKISMFLALEVFEVL